ncbi:MAG: amidohydrolase family protein [Armatimonadota bacterium]|nr:amidohydrolase family protein [Armatimonadota bacterium]
MIGEGRLTREFVEHGRVGDCPVIDTHGHFGPYQAIYFPRWRPDDVLETMDRCGVRWLLMSAHAALVDTTRGNREMADLVAQHPGRFRGWWALNPNYPERLQAELDDFESNQQATGQVPGVPAFVGFKLHPNGHDVPLTDDRYRPAFEYANERSVPILTHTWQGEGMSSYREVATVAEQFPDIPLLMGHAGYGDWEESAKVARDHEHVYLELTAAYSVRGALEIMVEHAGSRKILFGTDSPWFDPHYGIGCILSAYMTDEDRRNILYRNAKQLFGLPLE